MKDWRSRFLKLKEAIALQSLSETEVLESGMKTSSFILSLARISSEWTQSSTVQLIKAQNYFSDEDFDGSSYENQSETISFMWICGFIAYCVEAITFFFLLNESK